MNVIFWDTETNGLEKHHSVLSISAVKCVFDIENDKVDSKIIDHYERFYYRKANESIGAKAIDINGLTDDVIKVKRKNATYPEYFCNDITSFKLFCSDTTHFVGHNIFYDKQYINFWLPNMFCTMKSNIKILNLKRQCRKLKFPSLEETAKYYDIKIDENELHNSMYDSYITYQIFCKMIIDENTSKKVTDFLNN